MSKKQAAKTRVPAAILNIAEDLVIFEQVVPARLILGDNESPVVFVYGANASGKSFYLKLCAVIAKDNGIEAIPVSMRLRTSPGMHQCFMFSPLGENKESTGVNSLVAITGALRTANGRESKSLVILDEPDIGLSDGYAAALGEWLSVQAKQLSSQVAGIIICTHNKALISRYLECAEHMPHGVHMTEDKSSPGLFLDAWISAKEVFSISDLESLSAKSKQRRTEITLYCAGRKTPP